MFSLLVACYEVHIYIYTHIHTYIHSRSTANLRTKILDFRGFDARRILIVRGGIPRPIGNLLESLSRAILAGIILVGRLGVFRLLVYRLVSITGPEEGSSKRACLFVVLPMQHVTHLLSPVRNLSVTFFASDHFSVTFS